MAIGLFVAAADDDAVGTHEIVDRRALAQKLRVRDDAEVGLRFLMLANQAGADARPCRRARWIW